MDWEYDEYKQIGTDYMDDEEVKVYDENMRDLRNYQEEAEKIISLTDINKSKSIVDIGAGTGELALELAGFCEFIYALDISETMLEYARKKAERREITSIEFIKSGFLSLDLPESSIDVVTTQLALHHLPDFWKSIALKNIYDILKPGGKLFLYDVVFDFKLENYSQNINEFIELTGGESEKRTEDSKLHIKEEYSTYSWILEEICIRAGFLLDEKQIERSLFGTYVFKK